MKDHRKYIKWYSPPPPHTSPRNPPLTPTKQSLYVYNKIDSVSLTFLDKLAREPHTVVMSCELDLGINDVVERCWYELQLMRIYTKRYLSPFPSSPPPPPNPPAVEKDPSPTSPKR